MSTQLFIAGKNWVLSLAELAAYYKTRNVPFKIEYFSREFFTLTFPEATGAKVIDDLGGTIKIAEAKNTLPTQTIKEAFLQKNKAAQKQLAQTIAQSPIFGGMLASPQKVLFGVSVYFTDNTLHPVAGRMQRFVGSAIKDELAAKGKKSDFMGYSSDRRVQLSHVEVLKKQLVENQAEVLVCIGKKTTWIASTVAVHNPFEFQKRDIYKPNQRKIFAMPPRLARMMVNLSACTKGKTLLDPFCGVGTILQEALLEEASVVGLDVNGWCVEAAEENLEWLIGEYGLKGAEFRVMQSDVGKLTAKVGLESMDCIVSEPDLGPALKDFPTVAYAEKIVEKLEPLFHGFIEQAYAALKPNGRLVLVTPYIATRSGEAATMRVDEQLEQAGFKRVYVFERDMFSEESDVARLVHSGSLVEIDERHKVGREIHILQK
ncbi:MAG: methyltransferase domain-containing protein [Candidatus Bathyarchaeota archaeon]|nr:methyltransferase domain-containing protein [Candidatus Bathyarchaeota archaeon]